MGGCTSAWLVWTMAAALQAAAPPAAVPAGPVAAPAPPMVRSPGPMAVLDTEKVVRAMGWGQELLGQVKAAEADATAKAELFRQQEWKKYESRRADLAAAAGLDARETEALAKAESMEALDKIAKLKKEHKEELLKAIAAFTQAVRGRNVELAREFQARRAAIQAGYRDDLRAPARRVAEARGFSSVLLLPNDNLVYYAPEVDISNAVIDDLQAHGLRRPTPIAPPTTGKAPTGP